MAGFVLDSYNVLLYVFLVQTLRSEFHWSAAIAGLVSSATLITSALGGIGAGFLSDRIGRRRTLILTILVYSIGSGGSAAATGLRDSHLLAMHRRIRARRRMVGRRCAGGRKLAAAPSRQSHRAHAIRMGPRLHARSRRHRVHPAAFRMARALPHRTPSGAAHHLDPAQSEGAAPLDRERP